MKHSIWITFALLLVSCSLLLAQGDKQQQIPTKIFRLPPGKSHTIGGIQFMMLGWEELSAPEQTTKASRRIRVEFIVFNPPENPVRTPLVAKSRLVDEKGNSYAVEHENGSVIRPLMPGERGRYRLEFIVPRDAAGLNFAYANTTNDVLPYDLEFVPFFKLFYPERKDGLDVVQTVAAANADMVILMANVSVALKNLQRRLPGVKPGEMQVALCSLGEKSWSVGAPKRIKGERRPRIAAVAAGIASERISIRISQVRNAQTPDRKHWPYTDLGLLPLKLTVTNRGNESYRFSTSDFCLVDSAGFDFKEAGSIQNDAMLGEWNTLVEVPPGKTITFPMVFWAPKDPGKLWIRFEESSLNRDGPGSAVYNCHLPPEALQSIVYFEED